MGWLLAGVFCVCTASHARPARGLRLGRHGGRSVNFIRIQKTGSSTWGEHIMPKICAETHQVCNGGLHLDYDLAKAQTHGADALVTLLRDPVERTLSEFFFFRSSSGFTVPLQLQWDLVNETFLRSLWNEPDDDRALDIYLHAWPQHPSFNRQVLYLAGFKAPTSGQRWPFRWTGGVEQQRQLLSKAKAHLADITAFGFTECFVKSAVAMASALGWDRAKVTRMAIRIHARAQRKQAAVAGLWRHRGNVTELREVSSSDFGLNRSWRSLVDASTIQDIERLNWADMELHRYALEQFRLRTGRECVAR